MFTGIIEEIGVTRRIWQTSQGLHLLIEATQVLDGTNLGDSIAVNGTCLTVTDLTVSSFTTGLSPETRRRTNLESLRPGQSVNLERAVSPETRMGGHFVQGHVDAVGTITGIRRESEALWLTIHTSAELIRYIVAKGFITLDGVSLTVAEVSSRHFNVNLISYTQRQVTLARQGVGYRVNIEVDILGKYAEKNRLPGPEPSIPITEDFLIQHGYK